jgi:crotonobetainyl-CoA:carnitine CoA-transferase CaiB-like acyl-CoA transferase
LIFKNWFGLCDMKDMNRISNVKVVEFASVLAGPLVGNLFSELGAEVVKIENLRTGGDITRHWRTASEGSEGAVSSYYASANYRKRVLMADLRNSKDRDRVKEVVRKADVIISNFKPDTSEKLGVDFASLRGVNARAVIAEIVGYKRDPERGAFDVLLQAETGYLSMTGHPDAPFAKIPVAMIDVLAAHQLRAGILAALYEQISDGKGRRVQVDLFASALSGLVNQGSAYLMNGDVAEPMGSAHPSIAPYGEVYTTKDRVPMIFAVGTDKQFRSLAGLLQLEVRDAWQQNSGRVQDRKALTHAIQKKVSVWKFADLVSALESGKIPFAPIKNIKDALSPDYVQRDVLNWKQEGQELRSLPSVTFSIQVS